MKHNDKCRKSPIDFQEKCVIGFTKQNSPIFWSRKSAQKILGINKHIAKVDSRIIIPTV